MSKPPITVVCEKCGGTGLILLFLTSYHPKKFFSPYEDICDKCGGSGMVIL